MPGTNAVEFRLDDKFWCVDSHLKEPKLGSIVSLTDNPGKMIGLQFDEKIGSNVSCDGAGAVDSCLWVRPDSIYTEVEWQAVKNELSVQLIKRSELIGNRFTSIVIDDDGNIARTNTSAVLMPASKE